MANPKHLAKLSQGASAWNKWARQNTKAKVDLSGAKLRGCDLRGARLQGADLHGAHLDGANLYKADLRHADLSSAVLDGANADLAQFRAANLSLSKLTAAELRGAVFTEANLSGATLMNAVANTADFRWARLDHVSFQSASATGCDLRGADLRESDLCHANFLGSNLRSADLTGTNLAATNFENVVFGYSVFGNTDLSEAVGLEQAHHFSASTIGVNTIYLSKGKIPEVFLRGCGVPDDFLTYAKSLLSNPIEFYSCFISYSTKDGDFADRLHADLQNKGVRCWFAPHDIQGGKKLHEQIDAAIRVHDKLLLILSPHSMESEWVKTEIAKARKSEVRDKRRVLFPIRVVPFETLRDWECFDADAGKDSAREIREYFIPDFSNWKSHDSYLEAFERLLKDLKAQA
jgi:uncharacterized protein YjbI with pentapeptide repeats